VWAKLWPRFPTRQQVGDSSTPTLNFCHSRINMSMSPLLIDSTCKRTHGQTTTNTCLGREGSQTPLHQMPLVNAVTVLAAVPVDMVKPILMITIAVVCTCPLTRS